MSSLIKGLSHVVMQVNDMTRSMRFYEERFGWQQVFENSFAVPATADSTKRS